MKATTVLAVLGLVVMMLAGCLGGANDEIDRAIEWLPCEHPYPCGDGSEWPLELEGPFELLRVDRVRVPSHDGVELDGWVLFPDVPGDIPLPAVVVYTPYIGVLDWEEDETPEEDWPLGTPNLFLDSFHMGPLRSLVENGHVVAVFSVRGTGHSGGCFHPGAPVEQKDPNAIVAWIASQSWSNGRVGFMGLSYTGARALNAAADAHPALKAVVVGGTSAGVPWSPQGVATNPLLGTYLFSFIALLPFVTYPKDGPGQVPFTPERACPEFAESLLRGPTVLVTEDRDEAHYRERTILTRLSGIDAAVLYTHGFPDVPWRLDTVWGEMTNAPKRALLGQWVHTFHFDEHLGDYQGGTSFAGIVVEWFGYWLKGLGDPPRVGVADYEDSTGRWNESTAWPPEEARKEVLYLRGGGASSTPGQDPAAAFRAAPATVNGLCGDHGPVPTAAVFTTDPLTTRTTIAGNPFAFLHLESDQEGGVFVVDLFDLGPDFHCEESRPVGATRIVPAGGAADLRFLHGNFVAQPFPVDRPMPVRVDHPMLAHELAPGHRLAVVVSAPEAFGPALEDDATVPISALLGPGIGQRYAPLLTLHTNAGPEASHIVIPVIEGTFGGETPTTDYPPRPFTSRGE